MLHPANDVFTVLKGWNATAVSYPNDRCVHHLFEDQVARTPDAVALVHEGAQLTYRELNERANQLAHFLRRACDIRTEDLVAIFLDRSFDVVIAILGILKAGAAYVPIDPAYPQARVNQILEDSKSAFLLSQEWHRSRLGDLSTPILCMRSEMLCLAKESTENPDVEMSSTRLAYVIYTSGSTGRPKGVLIEHRGVCNLALFVSRLFQFTPRSRVLQFASMSFDASVSEWAGSLLSGATLVLPNARNILVGDELASFIYQHKISFLKVPPSVLKTLPFDPFPTLEVVVTAGEKCPQEIIDFWTSGRRFINCYGPTEATIGATAKVFAPGDTRTTIGRPNANTRIYILDSDLEQVPLNAVGEICIAGDGVARGYLNRPELTAAKFVTRHIAGVGTERLYRTGDLGRFLENGEIEYLGRLDEQVKIRGFRIELSEVESLVARHPDVKATAVIAEESQAGALRLVTFVIPHSGRSLSAAELRQFISEIAPSHLIPATFVFTDEFPLTSNGKVDKKALATRIVQPAEEIASDGSPLSTDEERLAALWARLLRCAKSEIRSTDNFFELGGDSIMVSQLARQIRQELHVSLSLRTLFENPTLSGLTNAIKRAGTGNLVPGHPASIRIEGTGPMPLSYQQQGLWLLSRLEPNNPFYNITLGFRLRGTLDPGAIRLALVGLCERHEVLRWRFADSEGNPVRHIEPMADASLGYYEYDFRTLPAATQADLVDSHIKRQMYEPINLSAGPLLRATLLRLEDNLHVLLICIHHIVADGWSVNILRNEVFAMYNAGRVRLDDVEAVGKALAPLPIQYSTYVAWQHQSMAGTGLQDQIGYWREQLDELPTLALPTDFPRPLVPRYCGQSVHITIPVEVRTALLHVAQQANVTLFTVLASAFSILLRCYCSQDDIVFGTVVAGRNHAELEGLIGLFASTLVLRLDLSGSPTFAVLLEQTRKVLIDAFCNQDVPFEKLVEVLAPQRERNRNPLFQVMLVYQTEPPESTPPFGLTAEALTLPAVTSKFDLTMMLRDLAGGFEVKLEYDVDLFSTETAARMAEHYRRLLNQVADDTRAPIESYQLLTAEEAELFTEGWKALACEYPSGLASHRLFEQQARQTPHRLAMIEQAQQLTYGELDRRANQLARCLCAQGITLDTPVAVCMNRSVDLVVCVLAIWKAGGAYLPIAAALSVSQVREIVTDSRAPLLITEKGMIEGLALADVRQAHFEDLAKDFAAYDSSSLAVDVPPSALAYIIYTSGTTGRPKGVCLEHHTLINLIDWQQKQFASATPMRVALFASVGFDVSVQELCFALSHGHTLVIATDEVKLDYAALRHFLRDTRVEVLFMPTVLFHQFAVMGLTDHVVSDDLLSIIVAGEELKLNQRMKQIEKCFPRMQLVNQYGPTETHVVTAHVVRDDDWTKVSVPIGRPIQNTVLLILDAARKPVPTGIVGEIYLGGEGIAREYLHRPELSAERFLASDSMYPRLYRTGDLARWLPNGEIQYIGRVDSQVKIRGYRVELSEIEAVVAEHPSVEQCVVDLAELTPNARHLVGYYSVRRGQRVPTAAELIEFTRGRLSDYMVPVAFVLLNVFPLNRNFKLDRRALPKPGTGDFGQRAAPVAPASQIEQQLCELWSDLLPVQATGRAIGTQEDFFSLGGNSLLAMQMLSRVRSTFGVEIPLRSLFEAPTVARFAALVATSQEAQRHGSAADAAALLSIPRARRDQRMPLSFSQMRLWFLEQFEPGRPLYNIPAAIRLHGRLNISALERGFVELVRRHESLRTCFPSNEGEPYQQVTEPPDQVCVIRLVSPNSDEPLESLLLRLISAEAAIPFSLSQGPLLRVILFQVSLEHHVLFLCMHHIIADGWSLGVLLRELQDLYTAFAAWRPSPLSPLAIQVCDVACWEREFQAGGTLNTQLAYLQTHLAGLAPLELPTDHPRPPIFSYKGRTISVSVPATLLQSLKQLAQEQGATLYMVLLAAFQTLLGRYSGQTDIAVGSPVAHRTRTETEGLVGCFVNTLVLRCQLDMHSSFLELLAHAKDVCLQAFTYQDIPFERLVDLLSEKRDPSRPPLVQVLLVLQNAPRSELNLPGIYSEWIDLQSETAKFDLTLGLEERADHTLRGWLEYASDLWEGQSIERLWQHFLVLLQGIVDHPSAKLSALPLLTEAERHQILVAWNDTQVDFAQLLCIHQLFEAQVQRSPNAVAVVFGEEQLSYRELDQRANHLAHKLCQLGVGPDVLVALCIHRSLEMIVGLLGILKAGGAYIPIDPDYPHDRIAFMLQDAQPAVLVHTAALRPLLPAARAQMHVVCMDDVRNASSEPCEPPITKVEPSNAIYAIYTSGSTGHPKGVLNIHRGIANRILWMQAQYSLLPAHRVLQKTPFSFDVSGWEFYWPLLTGACLVLAKPGGHRDPAYLRSLIAQAGITHLHFIPSMLTEFLEQEQLGEDCRSLQQVFCSGEALGAALAQRFAERLAHVHLYNLYGPTEASIEVSYFACDGMSGQAQIPIGRPIANTQLYVLDPHLNPVPIGVPGELHIGGVPVARGYLNRPDLTAQKFIDNPFGPDRLYKTGDLARFLPDGNIEFLGRLDHQVKLRGFRIELSEIEAVLTSHPDVTACIVLLREDTPGDKRLAAYVTLQKGRSLDLPGLRAHLGQMLPDYMLPSAIIELSALPLTPSGKVDRKALPAPSRQFDPESFVTPCTETEEHLAEIFAQVLRLPKVSVCESFFSLGGHSLLAVQLVSKARRAGFPLSLQDLFVRQTVRELASGLNRPQLNSCLVGLSQGSLPGAMLLLPGAGGSLLAILGLARALGATPALFGLTPHPLWSLNKRPQTIQMLCAHYAEEVLASIPAGPIVLVGYSLGGSLALELACQLQAVGRSIGQVILLDTKPPPPPQKPIDLRSLLLSLVPDLAPGLSTEALKNQPFDEIFAAVLSEMGSDTNADSPAGILRAVLACTEATLTMLQHWSPRAPQAPVHLLRAAESQFEEGDDYGWSRHLQLASRWTVPGDHRSMLKPQHLPCLTGIITELLDSWAGPQPKMDQNI